MRILGEDCAAHEEIEEAVPSIDQQGEQDDDDNDDDQDELYKLQDQYYSSSDTDGSSVTFNELQCLDEEAMIMNQNRRVTRSSAKNC